MFSFQLEPRRGIRNDGIRRPQEAGAAVGQTQEGGGGRSAGRYRRPLWKPVKQAMLSGILSALA